MTEDKYATTIQNTELKNKVIKLQEELVDTQSLLSDLNLQLANQCEDRVMNVISSGLDKENHLDDFNRSNTFNNSIDMD